MNYSYRSVVGYTPFFFFSPMREYDDKGNILFDENCTDISD
jgi:hypothetical protein